MKICYIFSNIDLENTTGQSGVALRQVHRAKKVGYEVFIISNCRDKQKNISIEGVKIYLIRGLATFKTYFFNAYKIMRFLKEIKPDIVHVQGHLLIPFIYFLNKFTGFKLICTLPERIDYMNRFFRYLIVYSIRNIGLCFVFCQWEKDSLVELGVPEERIIVVYVGLRESFFEINEKKSDYRYDIFYYGDASHERGFDVLCNLVKKLPNLKFKFLIRWKGNESSKLKELSKFKNVSIDRSILSEPDLKKLISQCKLVILPYRWMGVQPPITLLETMALGKCVLTSNLPGSKELIIDNENTILIKPDDPINKTIQKIKLLLNNPALIENLGQNVRKTILKYYSSAEYNRVFSAYEMINKNFYEWRMFGNVGGDFVSRKEINTLLELLQPQSNDNILDVGTGSGRFARAIIKNFNSKVIGLDPDNKILGEGKYLKSVYLSPEQRNKYQTIFGNGQNLPFIDNTFDKAFCIRVLKYYDNPWKGIDEIIRVVKPGGIFILEITSDKSWESFINPLLFKIRKRRKILHFWEEKMTDFNPSRVKNYLSKNGISIIDEVPLHKVPPRLYSLFDNQHMNYLLDTLDKILSKITPKYLFSKSIVFKCKKHDKR